MRPRPLIATAWILLLLLARLPAQAADDFASLYSAIERANGIGSGEITLSRSIALEGPLPPISGSIQLDGSGFWLSGLGRYRILDVADGGSLALANITLTHGKAAAGESGGAVRLRDGATLEAERVRFEHSVASAGAAIAIVSSRARANLHRGSFRSNTALQRGGAILLDGGTLAITSSAFVDNIAETSGGAVAGMRGSASISNSSFQGNEARTGGAVSASGASMTLSHITMSDNLGFGGGDGLHVRGGTVSLRNSLISGRTTAVDCQGQLAENSSNFIADGSCSASLRGNPKLAGLRGALAHRPLLEGSPAINAASADACPSEDQLGVARPIGEACDIGALESRFGALPEEPEPPPPCTLHDNIIAANTDAPAGSCLAGKGHDTIVLTKDITLDTELPPITSQITLEGAGHAISGQYLFRILDVDGGDLTVKDLTLRKALGELDSGGALRLRNGARVNVSNVEFRNNIAGWGGAIAVTDTRDRLFVTHSSFRGNRASSQTSPNTTRDDNVIITHAGGAIHVKGGFADIRNSSFHNNQADFSGGAIEVFPGRLIISNSSFTNNSARDSVGGAILASGDATLTHLTLVNNSAYRGGGIVRQGGVLRLRNSLIAGSQGGDCIGWLSENSGNLIEDGSCSPMLDADPMLAEASDAAQYLAPMPGSPLIQAADPLFCSETDQLGNPRAQVGRCDIGAIETAPVETGLPACTVTTTHKLNFRDQPAGQRIGSVSSNTTLPAIARTPGWFHVEHDGATGWIHAAYAVASGDCV